MVIESVSYDLKISTLALVQIRARIGMCSKKVQVRKDRTTELLTRSFDDTYDKLTTDTENEKDAGEVSDKDELSGYAMTLDATKEARNEPEETELVRPKVEHLGEEYAAEVKHLFQSCPDVIAHAFNEVRPSKCKQEHTFELTSDQPII